MRFAGHQKILTFGLGLALMVAFWIPSSGKAQGIIYGDRINEGQVVEQNVLLNGTDVAIDGTINGDVLAFGRTITVNGQVNGSLLAIGQTITINGQVSGNLVVGAVIMKMGSESEVERDIYFAGTRFTLPDGSAVQRDLNILSLDAQFSGEIGRDIHAVIGPLQIYESLIAPLINRITTSGAAQQYSIAQTNKPNLASMGAGALIPISYWLPDGQEQIAQQAPPQIDVERLKSWGLVLLRNLVALLVIGLFGTWLVPTPVNWASEKVRLAPWRMAFSGVTFFLGGWFVAVLAFFLILALAIFFYTVSLPNLGFLLGALGLMGLGLGVSVFWLAIAYVSKLIVAILIGRLLLQWLAPRISQNNNLWPLLLGVILYAMVASIPYLGWVVATVVTFIGLGALRVITFPSTLQQKEVESSSVISESSERISKSTNKQKDK